MKASIILFWIMANLSAGRFTCQHDLIKSYGLGGNNGGAEFRPMLLCSGVNVSCCSFIDELSFHKSWYNYFQPKLQAKHAQLMLKFSQLLQMLNLVKNLNIEALKPRLVKGTFREAKSLQERLKLRAKGLTFDQLQSEWISVKKFDQSTKQSAVCILCDQKNHEHVDFKSGLLVGNQRQCKSIVANHRHFLKLKLNQLNPALLLTHKLMDYFSGMRKFPSRYRHASKVRQHQQIIRQCIGKGRKKYALDHCQDLCGHYSMTGLSELIHGEIEFYDYLIEKFKFFSERGQDLARKERKLMDIGDGNLTSSTTTSESSSIVKSDKPSVIQIDSGISPQAQSNLTGTAVIDEDRSLAKKNCNKLVRPYSFSQKNISIPAQIDFTREEVDAIYDALEIASTERGITDSNLIDVILFKASNPRFDIDKLKKVYYRGGMNMGYVLSEWFVKSADSVKERFIKLSSDPEFAPMDMHKFFHVKTEGDVLPKIADELNNKFGVDFIHEFNNSIDHPVLNLDHLPVTTPPTDTAKPVQQNLASDKIDPILMDLSSHEKDVDEELISSTPPVHQNQLDNQVESQQPEVHSALVDSSQNSAFEEHTDEVIPIDRKLKRAYESMVITPSKPLKTKKFPRDKQEKKKLTIELSTRHLKPTKGKTINVTLNGKNIFARH